MNRQPWALLWADAISSAIAKVSNANTEDDQVDFGEWALGAKRGLLMMDPTFTVPSALPGNQADASVQAISADIVRFGQIFKHSMLYAHIQLWEVN
jgi:hypothetical protein